MFYTSFSETKGINGSRIDVQLARRQRQKPSADYKETFDLDLDL